MVSPTLTSASDLLEVLPGLLFGLWLPALGFSLPLFAFSVTVTMMRRQGSVCPRQPPLIPPRLPAPCDHRSTRPNSPARQRPRLPAAPPTPRAPCRPHATQAQTRSIASMGPPWSRKKARSRERRKAQRLSVGMRWRTASGCTMIGAGKCAQLSGTPRLVPGRATATAGLDLRQVHVHFRQQGPCRARADRQRRSVVGLVFCAAGTQPPRPALPGPSAHQPIQTEPQAWVCGFACARCLSSRSCVCASAGEHACACANVCSCECACSGACVDEWTVVFRATPPVAVTGCRRPWPLSA